MVKVDFNTFSKTNTVMENALCKKTVKQIYNDVINDVIYRARDRFTEEGIDEDILQELKQTWEAKLKASGAVRDCNINEQTTIDKEQNEGNNIKANTKMPVQIILPPQTSDSGASEQKMVTLLIPQFAMQENYFCKLLTAPLINATVGLPSPIATTVLQHHVDAALMTTQNTLAATEKAGNASQVGIEELQTQSGASDMHMTSKECKPKNLKDFIKKETVDDKDNYGGGDDDGIPEAKKRKTDSDYPSI